MQTFPGKSKDFLKTHRQTSGKPKSTSFILHAELSTPHYKIMWMIKSYQNVMCVYVCIKETPHQGILDIYIFMQMHLYAFMEKNSNSV